MMICLDESVQLGQLGERLRADASGDVLAEYRNCLEAASLSAKKRLVLPLTPEQFDMTKAVADGASLSVDVVTAVWQSMHAGR
jgi:hypothetical protein